MYVVTRKYSGQGADELCDLVVQNKAEVEQLMRAVPGFVRYVLYRGDNDWTTATICNDKAGCEQSMEVAKNWIAQHGGQSGAVSPQVSGGEILFELR